jgi:hypothetical protein
MKNTPTDKHLYEKVKKNVYTKFKRHSAYRSGYLVKEYKKQFALKYAKTKNPYLENKKTRSNLDRWFREKWMNQRNEIGYKFKSDIYRPTKKISKKTPLTLNKITKKRLKKVRYEKWKNGRVFKF